MNFYLANNLIYDPTYASASSITTTTAATTTTTSTTNSPSSVNGTSNSSAKLGQDENVQIKTQSSSSSSGGFDMHARVKDYNLANLRVVLKACLLFNSMDYRNCPAGYLMSVQSFTHVFTNMQMSVPYPYMGKWYLAIWKECFDVNTK